PVPAVRLDAVHAQAGAYLLTRLADLPCVVLARRVLEGGAAAEQHERDERDENTERLHEGLHGRSGGTARRDGALLYRKHPKGATGLWPVDAIEDRLQLAAFVGRLPEKAVDD